mmetsp:Transcript_8207/g.26212  ORF Transcript_8207/g.26212 Transcript_8207/m.26212 type:complete len:223 (+) Transcript_8207:794-1462(+)
MKTPPTLSLAENALSASLTTFGARQEATASHCESPLQQIFVTAGHPTVSAVTILHSPPSNPPTFVRDLCDRLLPDSFANARCVAVFVAMCALRVPTTSQFSRSIILIGPLMETIINLFASAVNNKCAAGRVISSGNSTFFARQPDLRLTSVAPSKNASSSSSSEFMSSFSLLFGSRIANIRGGETASESTTQHPSGDIAEQRIECRPETKRRRTHSGADRKS